MSKIFADVWWSKIFRSLIDSGDLASMSGNAVKIYVALKSRVNAKSGLIISSMHRLSVDCGISEKSARRAIAELIQLGYVHRSPRPGRTSELRLIEQFPLRNGDTVIGHARFAYTPQNADQRLSEMREMLASPTLQGNETIRIELKVANNFNISAETVNLINFAPSISVNEAIEMARQITGGKTLQRHLERVSTPAADIKNIHPLDTPDLGQD